MNKSRKPVRDEQRNRRVAIVVVFAMIGAVALPALLLVLSQFG